MKRILFTWAICLALLPGGLLAAEKDTPTRIALLSDIHIMHGTNMAAKTLHRKHLRQAIAEVNAAKVDLVLVAGDLTEHGTPEEIGDFMEEKRVLTGRVWFVAGNHDVGNKLTPGKTPKPSDGCVTPWRLTRFEMHWGPTFWTRERAGVRVIGINTSIIGSDFGREKKMWSMLEKELAKPSDKPTLVLLHYPPFLKTADEKSAYFDIEKPQRERFLKLVQVGGVKAVLSGHTHTEITNTWKGVRFVTTPPIAYGLPKGKQKPGWTLLKVSPSGEVETEFKYLKE
jgi:3',5'-cyclic AMP phosphodiesterase CpdA